MHVDEGDLAATVAIVTGATRGAGRGIAAVLGERGATVFVTGRSTREGETTKGLPGTVEDTAEEVTARGGRGIPIRCDHTVPREVAALVRQVEGEVGRLDLLVNNVWGGYENYDGDRFDAPLQAQPFQERWSGMFERGVYTHLLMNHAALPLLLRTPGRLVVSTVAWAYGVYLGNLFYDVAKAAIIRMAEGLAEELRPAGIASVALAPGFMRTERVMASYERSPFDLGGTESPEYVGRAVAALTVDPERIAKTGRVHTAGDLAVEYGFTDVDGTRPAPFRVEAGDGDADV